MLVLEFREKISEKPFCEQKSEINVIFIVLNEECVQKVNLHGNPLTSLNKLLLAFYDLDR